MECQVFEASDPEEDDAPADTCRQCGVLHGDHPECVWCAAWFDYGDIPCRDHMPVTVTMD